jgi:putative heme-binding domain-containing protein
MTRHLTTLLLLLFVTQHACAQRNLTDIPVPDPEEERKTFQVAEGFEVNLFAADPLLAKPIQMNFDPAGRLWVASSETYPQIEPGKPANDKIIILEDTDEDGRADKTRVFADGLLIPTGIEPGDGGCYVGASTELLHLKDTDGDGKADKTRVLLSGFGTEDTHHIIHTLRWGPDGCLYFNQSIYIHSHIETPYGPRRLGGGGVWQYRPETERLEVYCKGLVNPWGFAFDRWGQTFVTDGAGGEGINYAFPGAVFPTSPGARRVLHGMNPGSPKFCGLEIISGRQLPDDWQDDLITHDFRGHRVCRFKLSEDGSGYSSREMPELIKTSHVAFRPIDVKMGPDGAIYIADWYNPIIQHGEVDFRDPRRDHTHGRIWRVTYKGKPALKRPKLVNASIDELLEALKSPEMWTRQMAKRVLKERNQADVAEGLIQAVSKETARSATANSYWVELLNTFQTIDHPQYSLAKLLLAADDHRYRAAGVRTLGGWPSQDAAPSSRGVLDDVSSDKHPRVRLESLHALRGKMTEDNLVKALAVLDHPMEENLDFALSQLLTESQAQWVGALTKNTTSAGLLKSPNRLLYLAKIHASPELNFLIFELLAKGKMGDREWAGLGEILGQSATPPELAAILPRIDERTSEHAREMASVLTILVEKTRPRRVRPVEKLDVFARWLMSSESSLAESTARAIGAWHIEPALPKLIEVCESSSTSDSLRQAAIEGLAEFGGPEAIDAIRGIVDANAALPIRITASAALVRLNPKVAAEATAKLLASADSQLDPSHVITAFIEQKDAAPALIKALKDAKLPTDVAKRAVRVASSSANPNAELVAALRTAGGISADAWKLSPEQAQQLIQEIATKGDAARGEAIYRRKDTACLKCHAIGGAGGQVGPDISSIGGSAQLDYLVESILEPSKKIKENYNSVIVQTDDGKVLTGVLVRQTDKDLILRNAEDQEIAVPLKSIEERSNGLSLMPLGLTDSLTRDELIDVVKFMSQLGKVDGGYVLSKAKLVRRWQVLENTKESSERLRRDRVAAAALSDAGLTWSPVYSNVAGVLPLDGLPTFGTKWNNLVTLPSVTIVRCELQVTTPGETKLAINTPIGVSLWIDGKPVTAAAEIPLNLSPGRHKLTFAVDREKRNDPLRVEVVDVAGSPANVQVVGGK